jgi:hypothetical protein
MSTGRMSTGQSRDFGGRVTGHRRLCFRLPHARCARHVGRQRRRGKKDGAMGAKTDADVRVAWSPRGNLRLLPPRPARDDPHCTRDRGPNPPTLGTGGPRALNRSLPSSRIVVAGMRSAPAAHYWSDSFRDLRWAPRHCSTSSHGAGGHAPQRRPSRGRSTTIDERCPHVGCGA